MKHTDPATPTVIESPETIKRFHRGDVRDDGKIFWAYIKRKPKGECWFFPDQFRRWRERSRQSRSKLPRTEESWAKHRITAKAWRRRNVKKVTAAKNARRKIRRKVDPVFALQARVRRNLQEALKAHDATKTASSSDTLGCSWKYFAQHISSQFLPGMSWANRNQWQVDHIVPLAVAQTKQDVLELSHYTNLRPLWEADNAAKGASLPPAELFPPHLLRFLPAPPGLPTGETA
jgi:hypothetical protein